MNANHSNLTKEDYILAKTDEKVFEKVFRANLKLVGYCEKKYCILFTEKFYHGEYENALEFGLYKAIMMYNPDKCSFSSLAIPVMVNEIKMLNRKNNSKTIQHFSKCFSLDDTIATNSKDGDCLILKEILSDGEFEHEQERLLEEFPDVSRLFAVVPDRVKQILIKLSDGVPQWKIGQDLNLSQSVVSRMIKKIGEKISRFLKTISVTKSLVEKGYDEQSIVRELNLKNGNKIKYYVDVYNYLYNDGPYVEITESWAKKPSHAKSGVNAFTDECVRDL